MQALSILKHYLNFVLAFYRNTPKQGKGRIAHQLIWGPESNDFNISIVVADCVPLPQGIKGCNSAHIEVLI